MKVGVFILVVFCVCWDLVRSQCPPGCLCFRTTVRCMFLQMERVPRVPPDTTILDLRFNKIKDIPRGTFRRMRNLNTLLLNNNEVERLEAHAFEGVGDLRYLYLYKNKIDTIDADAFKNLHNLEQLFLHGNRLERLPHGLFSDNSKLQRLRLDSNALICDCQLIWLVKMLKNNHANTQAAVTCEHPGNLKGRSLMTVNLDEFDCSNDSDRPHFTTQPRDVEIRYGSTAYFNCRAEGEPDPQILWMHNNELVNPAEDRVTILADGTLMIQNARDSDQGSYECIARNTAGEVKTNSVELRMPGERGVPPEFSRSPIDVHVLIGDSVDMPCEVRGHPHPEITWTLNGNNVRLTERVSIVGGGLHIVSVREEDRGLYRCRAENSYGTISATARLNLQVTPHFVLRPQDVAMVEGSTGVFQCDAMGDPSPLISWFKDDAPLRNNGRYGILDSGRTLRIASVELSDRGFYTCRAENAAGGMEATAELQITPEAAPNVQRRLADVRVPLGDDVTLDCSADGQPSPQFRWMKQGTTLRNERKYSIEGSELTIRRAIQSDEGVYECFAENTLGFARKTIHLFVTPERVNPGDRFVEDAIRNATRNVDNRINMTRSQLFDRGRTHGVEDMLSLFRYPSAEALELARAEEIFEQTLELVHRHVSEGHRYDLDGHSIAYRELLSPAHLSLIANMSGCFRRTFPTRCTNMCFHKKYRTPDGSCNNLQNPSWGAANNALRRLLPPVYENGFNSPVGWDRARLYQGTHLPSPRLVSSVMMSTERTSMDEKDTHMLMQWGQFVDHDIDLTPQSVSQHTFNDGRRCNETCENSYPCFPIPVPSSDIRVTSQSCLGFHRSSATCNTGTTSIFFKTFSPRQQLNALTAYIDGSNVYGSDDQLAERLRDLSHEHGHLLVGSLSQQGKRLLPYDFHGLIGQADCQIETSKRYIPCFLAGDTRANEQLALTAMHTLWMREHNRIATELLKVNPHWDGNMLYHEARKIVGAMMQRITYTAWLPKILGPRGMEMLGAYKGYDPSVDSSVTNEFATAAMRFGHSLVNPIIHRLNESFAEAEHGSLPLHRAFFSPYRLVEEGGIDPVLRGMFAVGVKMRMPNEIMNTELTEKLFALANSIGQDLASLNIQRGRDHGLPFYNEYRKICNLTTAEDFHDLREEISDRNTRDNLELLYGHVDNIDLFVGGMAEDPMEGAKVGPTFACILADQFRRIRDGDRFWYEDPMVFNSDQLLQIQRASLARVLCDSGDSLDRVQPDVFTMVHNQDDYVSCDVIPQIDLKMWSDCCMDCGKAGDFRSITSHFRRRRSSESARYSRPADQPFSPARHSAELQTFKNQVYNKNEMDVKMAIMENKMESMESIIHQLENSMKGMKRKMRKMRTLSGDMEMCVEEGGEIHKHRETWKKDDCTTCICRDGRIKCKADSCPGEA